MKDIDFDELDRAVSSVLGGATPKPQDTAADTQTVAPDANNSVELGGSSVTYDTDQSDAVGSETLQPNVDDSVTETPEEPQTTASASSTPPLAIKRRGKFMDVVHPSSDMNPSSTTSMPAHKSIAPLGAVPASEPQDQPVSTATPESTQDPVEETSTVIAETVTETEVSTSNLETTTVDTTAADSATQTDEQEQEQTDSTESSSEQTTAPDQSVNDSSEQNIDTPDPTDSETESVPSVETGDGFGASAADTPETPFLSDAKVEKRPLGGFGGSAEVVDETPSVDSQSETGASQSAPSVPLPRELQPDIVKVEAIQDDTLAPADPVATATAPTLATVPAVADADGDTHSLFDTSSYHAPISHANKSSIPVWVWWLVGLLACLAAGAGVGYFLFVAGL